MNKLVKFFLFPIFFTFISTNLSYSDTVADDFDFLLVLTQQDLEMNWWFSVPSQFGPNISLISTVSKGEFFKILPVFNHYGTTEKNEVKISYDVEIRRPDGTIDESVKDVNGYEGAAPGPFLLPAIGMLAVSFDPEDPYGEYLVNVTAYDHLKKQKAMKSEKINLVKFALEKPEEGFEEWFLSYPTRPKPSFALSSFTSAPRPYLDDDGHPLWSALWFYKHIYSENEFLIPHTIEFYKTKADKQQQKDIILLFHLLNKVDSLPVDAALSTYAKNLKKINIPDPYQEIVTGDQLDMLWAEYFATSRVKPIRQILTALKLSTYSGTLDKIKSGEISKSDENKKKATLEAVFQSAVWSIMSNCRQSPLLFHYCIGLYESNELDQTEKSFLGAMLRKVSDAKQKQSDQ